MPVGERAFLKVERCRPQKDADMAQYTARRLELDPVKRLADDKAASCCLDNFERDTLSVVDAHDPFNLGEQPREKSQSAKLMPFCKQSFL